VRPCGTTPHLWGKGVFNTVSVTFFLPSRLMSLARRDNQTLRGSNHATRSSPDAAHTCCLAGSSPERCGCCPEEGSHSSC
jgi:hypothetical protein